MTEQWQKISEDLRNSLESGIFKVWIAPLEGAIDGTVLHLVAPSAFAARWVEARLGAALCHSFAKVCGMTQERVQLKFTVRDDNTLAKTQEQCAVRVQKAFAQVSHMTVDGCTPSAPVHHVQGHLPMPLEPLPVFCVTSVPWRHDFTDFIEGSSNALAAAAARDICRPSSSVETLFVSAPSGLGKTHLIHAIGQTMASENRPRKVGYLTAEEFTHRFVMASRLRQMDAFKAALRNLDVLLLDDVHFFQGKEKTQDEALATIKHLQARGSRMVLTSSFNPRELHNVNGQLVSHFCSGLLAHMEMPTLDMRRNILQHKARVHQVMLPEDVGNLLASHLTADVRQLESCLSNLIYKARVLKQNICLELALDVLKQYGDVHTQMDVGTIIRLVCQSYQLSQQQLSSRSRRQEYVLARNTAYYLARKHTKLSLEQIGEMFQRRHTTVIKGITSVERELQRQSSLGRQLHTTVELIERQALQS